MTIKLLRRPATILLAALLISVGCTPSGENSDKDDPTPAVAGQPAPTTQSETAPSETVQSVPAQAQKPPREAKLQPLTLPLPDVKNTSPLKSADDAKPAEPAPLKKAASEPPLQSPKETGLPPATLPKIDKPHDGPRKLAPTPTTQQTKPPSTPNGLRKNPLRDNRPPSDLQNPMREAKPKPSANMKPNAPVAKQPLARQALPTQASPQQSLPAKPLAKQPATKQPTTKPSAVTPPSGGQTPAAVHSPVGKSQKDAAAFNPIKENGPIFVDWKKPTLAIVITGREDGYIEPCGCAGLDRMKGGLSRRHTMIKELKDKGWPLLCIDVGGLSKGYGVQAELKFQITVDAMKKMGYQAIGFSPNDLRLPVDSLVAVAAPSDDNPSPFVSANVGLLGFDAEITTQWRVVDVGGIKIGVTSVLGKEYQKGLASEDVEFVDPKAALQRVVPELKKQCEVMILLAHATQEESIALSKEFKDFAVVVTSGGASTPPAKPTVIEDSKALLIGVGEKSMDAIVLGLFRGVEPPYRYQRVPLDSRFVASQDMKDLMKVYQEQLKTLGLAGLAIKPVTHPLQNINGNFVGSKACENCHEESYKVWKKSGHAKAWSTLQHTDPPRNSDPECISCHVIGWHPTKHFPYKGGFLSEKLTPEMQDVGCESCHGPGEAHVKAEMGNDEALQLQMQKAVRITKQEAQKPGPKDCHNCHDLDNSPDFKFETYWPKIEHIESE